jgi:hypothetical protein
MIEGAGFFLPPLIIKFRGYVMNAFIRNFFSTSSFMVIVILSTVGLSTTLGAMKQEKEQKSKYELQVIGCIQELKDSKSAGDAKYCLDKIFNTFCSWAYWEEKNLMTLEVVKELLTQTVDTISDHLLTKQISYDEVKIFFSEFVVNIFLERRMKLFLKIYFMNEKDCSEEKKDCLIKFIKGLVGQVNSKVSNLLLQKRIFRYKLQNFVHKTCIVALFGLGCFWFFG